MKSIKSSEYNSADNYDYPEFIAIKNDEQRTPDEGFDNLEEATYSPVYHNILWNTKSAIELQKVTARYQWLQGQYTALKQQYGEAFTAQKS